MAEMRVPRVEQGQTKVRNVPIAVTPEGFWCCPSPMVFQKTLKPQNPLNKPKFSSSPPHKTTAPPLTKHSPSTNSKPTLTRSRSGPTFYTDQKFSPNSPSMCEPQITERAAPPKVDNVPRKVTIEFGELGTSDLKVVLVGKKQGFYVNLRVHKNVVMVNSCFLAQKISELELGLSCLQIDDCDDVETYIETVGLMYCKEIRQRLIKLSVPRILRILKVAELLGFKSCINSCLEYLEAVPWVGDEEEENVISSVLQLQGENLKLTPILKRVSSDVSQSSHKDTVSHIIQLVLESKEDKARREMKFVVLKLLRENNNSSDLCNETIYDSCRSCLASLLSLFKHDPNEINDAEVKFIALEADNLSWLLEILTDRQAADEFALMWAHQKELADLHSKWPIVSRYHVSCITARLVVAIGKGEVVTVKGTRILLLNRWLEPLINDYSWLQHGCRAFDRKVVEEGIGRTILTLPLEEQQSILLSWLQVFMKSGDNNCPNLQKAFEVWWRRTFVRPRSLEGQGSGGLFESDDQLMVGLCLATEKM